MFDQLFVSSHALTRQRSAPLADERRRFLTHCAAQGMTRKTLRLIAELLVGIENRLRLAERPNATISKQEIEDAGTRWVRRKIPSPIRVDPEFSRQLFMRHAVRWLAFMERLQAVSTSAKPYDDKVAAYADFMRVDRGLSENTIERCCNDARKLLERLYAQDRPLSNVSVRDIDSLLVNTVTEGHYARVSVQTYASSLRTFFRFAEERGWCKAGLAASIMAPRVFSYESLPSAPSWSDVQRLISSTDEDSPSAIRDHAILMILAVYGVRSGEIASLRLEDIDWKESTITFTRSKQLGRHCFPLVQSVGQSIVRYLKEARPVSVHREVFLLARAPYHPITSGTLWPVVAERLRSQGVSIRHHGPHALRHACATKLINDGLSLKEVGDHLGHRSLDTTRIYAKMDLAQLREVSGFDLGGVL